MGGWQLNLVGQSYITSFKNYSVEDGLSGRTVYDVIEDGHGFVWISTWLGIDRFDGYRFQKYDQVQYGFRSNRYKQLLVDKNGHIWMMDLFPGISMKVERPRQYVDIFDPIGEQLLTDSILVDLPFKIDEVKAVEGGLDHDIWLTLITGELYVYDGKTFEKRLEVDDFDYLYVLGPDLLALLDEADHELRFLHLDGKVIKTVLLEKGTHFVQVIGEGRLMIGQVPDGEEAITWMEVGADQEPRPFEFTKEGQAWEFNLPETLLNFLFALGPDGRFWIHDADGLKVFDSEREIIHAEPSNVQTYAQIRFGGNHSLWIPHSGGVWSVSVQQNPFVNYGLSVDELLDFRGITEDAAGNVYFNEETTYRIRATDGGVEEMGVAGKRGAYVDRQNMLWLGEYTSRVFKLKLPNGLPTVLTEKEYRPSEEVVSNVFYQSRKTGQLYVGATNVGLFLVDRDANELNLFKQVNEFKDFQFSTVNCFLEDASGIWLGTSNGLFLLDEKEGIVAQYPFKEEAPYVEIYSIHKDEQGVFWLGTYNEGLIRWQADTEDYVYLKISEGLSDNTIYAIYEDKEEGLWMSSNRGLMQMDKVSREVKTFLPADGLPHEEFNSSAHLQARDGRLYFGCQKGVTAFYPEALSELLEKAMNKAPVVSSLRVLNRRGEWQESNIAYRKANGELNLKANQVSVFIQLAALDFNNPEKSQFAYQLSNIENKWKSPDKNQIELLDLPYGEYDLLVKGRIRNGNWSDNLLRIPIRKAYPFYWHWELLLFASLFILTSLYFYNKRRKRLKREREKKVEETIALIKRTQEQRIREMAALVAVEKKAKQEAIEEEEARKQDETEEKRTTAEDQWLEELNERALILIENSKFSTLELAAAMNLSDRQLRRKLKSATEMSPVAYLREIRLQKAEQLLKNQALPTVAEVCYAVGFSTPKHFSRLFKERFGLLPSSYLSSGKKNTTD